MGKKEKEGYPFAKLEDSNLFGQSSEFYGISGDDNTIIGKSFVGEDDPCRNRKKITTADRVRDFEIKIVEFRKILERCGIHSAKTDYVIGADPINGVPSIFCVTDRVEGETLGELKSLSKETIGTMDGIYAKMIDELLDSYEQDGYFWYDIKNDQFMYGIAPGDTGANLYLIDTDPNVFKWDDPDMEKESGLNRRQMLDNRLRNIAAEILGLESVVDEKKSAFPKTREKLGQAGIKIRPIS